MNSNFILVGMADIKAARTPDVLTTLGLGSCVGIALYDDVNKVAGLAHAMLPDSTLFTNNGNRWKYVDTSIVDLLNDMQLLGARKECINAKLVGGAQMFAFNSTNEALRIGYRNVEAAIKVLNQLHIPIIASETGENYGRTVELYSEDGRFIIKTISHGIKAI